MATKKAAKGKRTSLSSGQKVGIGVGLTAAALAAAGGYFLYGSKNAAKNRKQVKSWALKARAEVLEGLEGAKHMTKEEYEQLVASVIKGYRGAKGASARELADLATEMHAHWREMERTHKKPAKKAMKKTAKKK